MMLAVYLKWYKKKTFAKSKFVWRKKHYEHKYSVNFSETRSKKEWMEISKKKFN